MKIPFVDLKAQYLEHKEELDTAIANVINDTAFIRSSYVKEFEKQFAEKYGVKHCIGVGNGTDALYIALKMLGVGEGDEVITVANSWIATSEVITQTGAKVVFLDTEKLFYTIDPDKIREGITVDTKAVIPVHLYGQPAKMDEIKQICTEYNLFLIEDCAQAHFAEFEGQRVGTFGDVATFSFYPGKNLGAYGDAGAIITDNDALAEECRAFANHGALQKPNHVMEGINSRLDGIQAAVLSTKLKHIDKWTELRVQAASYYTELLEDIAEVTAPQIRANSKHVFHVYCILCCRRNELTAYLKDNGVATVLHYPTPLPFLKAYEYLKYKPEDFPVVSANQERILSLPMYPELTKEQQRYVVDLIRKFYSV